MFNPQRHHRHSIRLAGHDYRMAGAYFVTICVERRRCVFGRIEKGVMRPNRYGAIVAEQWQRTAELRPNVGLDAFVVMPNHFHAIVFLDGDGELPVGAHGCAPDSTNAPNPRDGAPTRAHSGAPLRRPRSLSSLVAQFKATVTRTINLDRAEHNRAPVQVWQRNYFERIIRDEKELNDTRRYIIENPARWNDDVENPANRESQP